MHLIYPLTIFLKKEKEKKKKVYPLTLYWPKLIYKIKKE